MNVPKGHRGKIHIFWEELLKVVRVVLSAIWCLPFDYKSYENPWTISIKRDTITTKSVSQSKCITERKKVEIWLAMERSGRSFFSTDLGHIFGSNVGKEFGVTLRERGLHKSKFVYDIVQNLMIYTDRIEHNIADDTRLICCIAFFFLQSSKLGTL